MRKSDGKLLVLLIPVAVGVWLVQTFGWWLLAIIGVVAAFIWLLVSGKSEEQQINELLAPYPKDEFGPVIRDPDQAKRFYGELSKISASLSARLRIQQVIRESIEIALRSKNAETAASRWETVEEMARVLVREHNLAPEELQPINAKISAARTEFRTVRYINEAQGFIDKAASVKTAKAKEKHMTAARDVIERGLADSAVDHVRLTEFIASPGSWSERSKEYRYQCKACKRTSIRKTPMSEDERICPGCGQVMKETRCRHEGRLRDMRQEDGQPPRKQCTGCGAILYWMPITDA